MYLYDRNGDKIEIYSMEPKHTEITEYKRKEMEKILLDHRLLEIETNSKNLPFAQKFTLQREAEPIDIEKKTLHYSNKKIIGTDYHRLQAIQTGEPRADFMERNLKGYYLGAYDYSQIVRVHEYDNDNQKLNFIFYLLLNNYYIKKSEHSNIQTINKIVNIPETLYLLELLKRGQFSLLDNKDITEQLKLFKISKDPVKVYTLKELESLGQYGLGRESFCHAIHKVRESEGILERIRRKK